MIFLHLVGSPELQAAIEDGDDEDTGDENGPHSSANTPTDTEKEIFWKTPEKVCGSSLWFSCFSYILS